MPRIDANPAAGTRDFLPDEVERRDAVFAVMRDVFRRYGFAALDTPAFERLDVLAGKYGDEGDQLMFKLLRRGAQEVTGAADLALRYDLTVPLARVIGRYGSQLPLPFKRYHIAPVWRADRPAKGRFREFYQCDVDVVGSDSPLADAETILVVVDALEALGLSGFRVQLNSRKALTGLVDAYGVPPGLETDALGALDKLDKIGADGVAAELDQRGVPAAATKALGSDLAADDMAGAVRERLAGSAAGQAGLAEVDRVLDLVGSDRPVAYAPVLARGLAYYTGPVFEVVHDDLDVTLAGGGRYDGLVGMFSGQDLPATGGSLGIERILLLLAETTWQVASGPVVVTTPRLELHGDALRFATELRAIGVATDLYVGESKLSKQFKYADRRNAAFVVVIGPDEISHGTVTLRDMNEGLEWSLDRPRALERIAELTDSKPPVPLPFRQVKP